jgi:hypothetical protein
VGETTEKLEAAKQRFRPGERLAEDSFHRFLASEKPFPALNQYLLDFTHPSSPGQMATTTGSSDRVITSASISNGKITDLGTGRALWVPAMGDGSSLPAAKPFSGTHNPADYNHFPLFTYEMISDFLLQNPAWLPPRNTCLDDRMVFMISFLEDEKTRYKRYPADFSTEGEVRSTRTACGLPPKIVDKEMKV